MKMKKLSVKALMSLILSAILFVCDWGIFANRQILWRFMRRIQQSRKQKVRQRKAVQKAQRPVMITRTVPVVEKITQSSPQRIQRKIPQKAQPRKHGLPQNAPARKNAVSMRWMRIVRCVQRIIRNVLISIRA